MTVSLISIIKSPQITKWVQADTPVHSIGNWFNSLHHSKLFLFDRGSNAFPEMKYSVKVGEKRHDFLLLQVNWNPERHYSNLRQFDKLDLYNHQRGNEFRKQLKKL